MKVKKKSLLIWLCLTLLISSIHTSAIYAAETKNTIEYLEPVSLGTIKLKENVTAKVLNLIALPDTENQALALTLQVNNKSNSEVNFLDYWVQVNTKSGAKLNLQLADSKLNKVSAGSSVNIVFVGTMGKTIKLSDLIIKVIQWDFSVSSYTRVLGEISVPSRYNPITPASKGRIITVDQFQTSIAVKQAVIGKSDSYYQPEITLTVRNDGNRTIQLPDYQLFILAENNLMYPLNVKDFKGTSLDPKTEKTFKLTTQIPNKVKESNWKLAIMNVLNEGKDKQPLALYELPKAQVTSGEKTGQYYDFTTANGMYSMKLNTIYRLPIEDDDLIVSSFTIANKSNKTLPIPELKAEYTFNDSVNKSANVLENNKLIALQPNQTVNVQFSTRVPYTFSIGETKIAIKSKESTDQPNSESINLVTFNYKDSFNSIPKLTAKSAMKIEDVGYRSEVLLKDYQLYSGVNTDILSVQLKIRNLEKRQATHPRLAGYFEKDDGTIFEAAIETINDKIGPSGTGVLQATATLPKGTSLESMRFVLGKAILESTQTGSKENQTVEKLTGYANPYSFQLPDARVSKNDLQQVDLTPFELTIDRIATQIRYQADRGESKVMLEFDYTLNRDLLTKANLKDKKIVIELVDIKQGTKFAKEMTLPSGENTSSNDNILLELGKHTVKTEWDNNDVFLIIQDLKEFEFNIYSQAQAGYRSLIATQKFNWLTNRSLN